MSNGCVVTTANQDGHPAETGVQGPTREWDRVIHRVIHRVRSGTRQPHGHVRASRPNRRFEFVEDLDVDICVYHLVKSNADKALHRGMGSIDLAAGYRSVLMAEHDADDTHEEKGR